MAMVTMKLKMDDQSTIPQAFVYDDINCQHKMSQSTIMLIPYQVHDSCVF